MMFHLFQGGVKLKQTTQATKEWLQHRNNVRLAKQLGVYTVLASILLGAVPVSASTLADKTPTLIAYNGDQSDLRFDTSLPTGVEVVAPAQIQEKIGTSRYEDQQKKELAALAASRAYTTQTVKTADPGPSAKRALVQEAASAYGVPWEVLEAVWQVETGKSWNTTVHSSAGAQGPAQFMPTTWSRYGVDGNGDGVRNINDAQDAIYGAAHYLAVNGASHGEIRQALLAYNHADWYVNKVLTVARSIGYTG